MSLSTTYSFRTGQFLHWIACLLGTALVVLFGTFAVADPPPLSVLLMPEMWALLLTVAGYMIVWKNDLLGGVLSMAGIAAFVLMNYEKISNLPSDWVFPLCLVPSVLAIAAGLMRRAKLVPPG